MLRQKLRWTVIIGILVLLALGFTWLIVRYSASTRVAAVGDPAPDISAVTVSSQPFDLHALQGEPVVIDYFAPWCQPCVAETPTLIQFAKQVSGHVHVVLIDRGDPASMVKNYIRQFHLPSSIIVVLDPNDQWSQPYGVTGQPETVFVSATGRITAHKLGPLTVAQLTNLAGATAKS